jgi:squalene-hopene/tetraprenyl-beta-curcumene cyclase
LAVVLMTSFGLGFGCLLGERGESASVRAPSPPDQEAPDLLRDLDLALQRAVDTLLAAQSPDGAWRAGSYPGLRDGSALTPLVLKALVYLPRTPARVSAATRAAAFLTSLVGPADGASGTQPAFVYPAYTAAAAAMALSVREEAEVVAARAAWERLLRAQQLTEQLGWKPTDAAYGAWCYGPVPPGRPPGEADPSRGVLANLSATLFAVGALRMTGARSDDPALVAARRFIERCQNLDLTPGADDAQRHDGGFFASPTAPFLNKAGEVPGEDGARPHWPSYGGATADGLRALLACGLAPEHPRVVAARAWLTRRFDPERVPGDYTSVRAPLRDGYVFYYAWSVSHALVRAEVGAAGPPGAQSPWAPALTRALLARQRPDGTWRNDLTEGREDEPLLATAWAVAALANCRLALKQTTP